MIRSDVLDGIDQSLKFNRNNEKPFGGVQIILLGDIHQLPPVVRENEQDIFDNFYPYGHYFFHANCFQESNIKKYELKKVYSNKDLIFLDILNNIRIGNINAENLQILNERVINNDLNVPSETIILSPTNRKVDGINRQNLEKLNQKLFSYLSTETGDFKEKPADEILQLKIGAQVMLIKNDTKSPKRWVNGSIGVVTELSKDSIKLRIKNKIHKITQDTWEKFNIIVSKIIRWSMK